MRVRVLESTLIDQIAAGEVVERPAAVVKELVENSLDAGATSISVDLREGGRALVRVADDGCGMDPEDARACLERHATSKIRTMEDLEAVATLGFRGEALPSIASVSRFELLTRPHDAEVGTRVRVEGGEVREVAEAGCAPGTDIHVRSLFYNVPVRRRFMRTVPTELGHCAEALVRLALAHPGVDFRATHDGRETLRAPRARDRAGRAAALLGPDARALLPVDYRDLGVRVRGLVSPVGVHRPSGTGALYLFVNGRFVRDPVARRGVTAAYRGLVPKGRFPLVVLDLELDPRRVDVNVHPTKTEVRFSSPRDLVRVLEDGIRGALHTHGGHRPGPPPPPPQAEPLPLRETGGPLFGQGPPGAATPPPPRRVVPAHPDDLDPATPWRPLAADLDLPDLPPPVVEAGARPELTPQSLREVRVVGHLGGRWLLGEGPGGELVVVDIRAARERVVLDRLLRGGEGTPLESPVVVELGRKEADALVERSEVLAAAGLVVDAFAPTAAAVRALPAALAGADPAAVAVDAARAPAEKALAAIASHATHPGDPSPAELRGLLAALDEVGDAARSHGRVVARLDAAELARRLR